MLQCTATCARAAPLVRQPPRARTRLRARARPAKARALRRSRRPARRASSAWRARARRCRCSCESTTHAGQRGARCRWRRRGLRGGAPGAVLPERAGGSRRERGRTRRGGGLRHCWLHAAVLTAASSASPSTFIRPTDRDDGARAPAPAPAAAAPVAAIAATVDRRRSHAAQKWLAMPRTGVTEGEIAAAAADGELCEDPAFPPAESSLYLDPQCPPASAPKAVEWKRTQGCYIPHSFLPCMLAAALARGQLARAPRALFSKSMLQRTRRPPLYCATA